MQNDYVEHALEREERAWKLLQWGSPAPLAEFDEALAVQGFYTRVQRERSDKALDAFDQELREPPGLSELDAFRILEARGVFSQHDYYSPKRAADGFYRQRLKQLHAEKHQGSPGRDHQGVDGGRPLLLGERAPGGNQGLVETARAGRRQVENVDAVLQGVDDLLDPPTDTHYKHGDIWHEDPEVSWIWDGWIAEGYFHTFIAMQKVGKSTFLLNLIAELIW